MAAGDLLLNGQNVVVDVFVDKTKYGEDKLVSFKLKPKKTQHEDQHLGQSRAHHDEQTDGYQADISSHIADNGLLQALLDVQAARDANLPIPIVSLGFRMNTRDGGPAKAYVLQNLTTDWTLDAGARNKRVMFDVTIMADDLVPVQK